MNPREELDKLQEFAKIGKNFGNKDLEHLDSRMGAFNYIRIADFIAKHAAHAWPSASLMQETFLDWGAGYGQITWLLRNRGLDARGYNVEERKNVSHIKELANLPMISHTDPVSLPFQDEIFSGVSSCGVLEHVPHPEKSLKEINRVLKTGGYFYIFMLPQKTSWVEYLSRLRGCSVHPIRYSVKGVKGMLAESGFEVEKIWKFNLLPKNLTGLPKALKQIYSNFHRLVYPMDKTLSSIPVLNMLSGVIEVVCRKK